MRPNSWFWFFCHPAAPLLSQSWRIADFQDTIFIGEDGSAVVHERIKLVFIGEWHGIHRIIPVEYPGPRGTNYTLFFDVTGVTDGDGQKLKYESKTSNGFRDLKIYIPDAVDTTRTVEITYIVRNEDALLRGSRRVLLECNRQRLAGPDRSCRCACHFRNGGRKLRAQAFTGAYGSAERDATTEVKAPTFHSRPPTRCPCAAE